MNNSASQQASMEEILSSIRSSLEEETSKVAAGAPQDAAVAGAADDVLVLTETDALPTADAAAGEDLIDLEAFAQGGQVQKLDATKAAQVVQAPLVEPVVDELAAAEPPAAVAEPVALEQVGNIPPAAPPASADPIDTLLAELGGAPADEAPGEIVAEPAAEPEAVAADEEPAELPAGPGHANGSRLELEALHGAHGLQVGLPAEVLAAALRPMVSAWLAENLPAVVERLVQEEISKLTQN